MLRSHKHECRFPQLDGRHVISNRSTYTCLQSRGSSRSLCEGIFAQEADGADSLQWEFLQVTSLCHRDNGKCVVY